MSQGKEFIICAALWVDDKIKRDEQPINMGTGFVVCGRRNLFTY